MDQRKSIILELADIPDTVIIDPEVNLTINCLASSLIATHPQNIIPLQ